MEKNSIFEVNGNAYDALSGAFLGHAPRVELTSKVQAMPVQSAPRQRTSIDGVVNQSRRAAGHHKPHNPQPTKTLMRHAVQQPYPGHFRPAPQQVSQQVAPVTPATVTPKPSSSVVNPVRAHRARVVTRSHAVEHFRPSARQAAPATAYAAPQPAAAPITTVAAPQPIAAPIAKPLAPVQQVTVLTKPLPKPAQPQQTSTRALAAARRPYSIPQQPAAPAAQRQHSAQPSHTSQASGQDLFSQALAQAKSHEEPAPKLSLRDSAKSAKRKGSRGRKLMVIASSMAVFVALSGIVAFQNRQQIQLQMASAKAGFAVASPMYLPTGYKNVKLQSASGNAAAAYQSDTQQRFTIVQKKSNWNSETLLDNFVIASNEDYRGFQSNGRTVYVYGKGNATWVNGGIWYQIKGASSLSDNQLVKIAASM